MKVKENLIALSRNLRKDNNPWETTLWQYLRGKRFNGLKFKRQVPIGNYIVDFCCDEKKLVIELDGGQHNESEFQFRDLKRENYLKKEGYTVLRFWNNEIDQDIEGVLEKISQVCNLSRPTGTLPSPGEGKKEETKLSHAWGEE